MEDHYCVGCGAIVTAKGPEWGRPPSKEDPAYCDCCKK